MTILSFGTLALMLPGGYIAMPSDKKHYELPN